MATKLAVMNAAIRHLGTQLLTRGAAVASVTGDDTSRVVAESYNEAVSFCLEQGHWKFASTRAKLSPSLTEVPTFGPRHAFAKPANYVRLNRMCLDEYFNYPTSEFDDRAGFWYSDAENLYVDFVSSEATKLGGYLAGWPDTFTNYVSLYLAYKSAPVLYPEKVNDLEIRAERAKQNALAKDAVLGPTQFLPTGSWSRSRANRYRSRSSNSSFYGS